MPNPLTLERPREAALAKGGVCLSERYVNTLTPMDWRCGAGHEWTTPYKNIAKGNWCPACGAAAAAAKRQGASIQTKRKGSVEKCQAMAEARGGRCLSEKYKDCGTKMLWECGKGHRW